MKSKHEKIIRKRQEKIDLFNNPFVSEKKNLGKIVDELGIDDLYDDYEKSEELEPFVSLPLKEQKKLEEGMTRLENMFKSRNIFPAEQDSSVLKVGPSHFHESISIPYSKVANANYSKTLAYDLISSKKERDYLYKMNAFNCLEEYLLPRLRKKGEWKFSFNFIEKELFGKCNELKIACIEYDKNTDRFIICIRADDLQDLIFACIVAIPFSIPEYFKKNNRLTVENDEKTFRTLDLEMVKFDYHFYFSCGCGK